MDRDHHVCVRAEPEATIAATAIKILGDTMLAKVWKDRKDDAERPHRLKTERVGTDKIYCQDELTEGNELVFAASSATKGELLDRVLLTSEGACQFSLYEIAQRNGGKITHALAHISPSPMTD